MNSRKQQTRRAYLATDSGLETFRPARHVKPAGIVKKALRSLARALRWVDPSRTTEQGSAGAASPSTYAYSLLAQRYERRQLIEDCRLMVFDDPRARRSTQMFAREAVRGGCTVQVSQGAPRRLAQRAQAIADEVVALANPKLFSWAWMLVVEGDLFVQAVVSGDRVTNAKRMPAVSIERLTDDTDEFQDPARAFEQIDIASNETVTEFPLLLMHHARWNYVDGERYGTPEVVAGRRMREKLELQEESQSIRRMVRAAITRLWSVGDKDNPGKATEVDQFKADNGFAEGRREVYDPTEVARDLFGNGLVTCQTLDGDPHIHEVDDLKYLQNVYASAALPTPPPLFNLDAESVNRDVLDDLRTEWLKQTQVLTGEMAALVRWLVEVALLLDGILPETVPFEVRFSDSSIEKPSEVVGRVLDIRRDRLISRRKAVQLLAEYIGVTDVDAEIAAIEAEESAARAEEPDEATNPKKPLDRNGRPKRDSVSILNRR
jgi:hypothetical protein